MDNKVLVNLSVPEAGKSYDVYLPVNRKIGNIIMLLNKSVNELSNGEVEISKNNGLYNADTGEIYDIDTLLIDTNIRNGTKLIMITCK